MTLFLHELKRNKLSLLIWSCAISFMLGVCVIIYPEMSSQMGEISDMFANMGAFSDAFGMDQLNFGEFMGYFGVECGNTLGLGGAIFAAILGISALAKEEKEHTAEFLLTHPVSRVRIVSEKLLAIIVQLIILNLSVITVTLIATLIIKENADISKMLLLFLANLILQAEIATVTFAISAFLKRGGFGIGLGLSMLFYFLNIVSNLSEDAEFLKFITPFGYTDGSHIISNGSIEIKYLLAGLAITVVGVLLSYAKYTSKDIT